MFTRCHGTESGESKARSRSNWKDCRERKRAFFFPETGGVTRFAAFCCSTTSEKTTQQRERERSDLDQRKELQKQKVKVNVLLLNNNSYDQDQRM